MRDEAHLLPAQSLRDEVRAIVDADLSLPRLLASQRDEPDLPDYRLLVKGQSPYYIVRVPIPGKSGTVWASRLPGIRPTFTEEEVTAVRTFGIQRVVCLVPTISLENLHGAYRYLESARSAFPDAFHQVEIVDHEIPGDDAAFERSVEEIDRALRQGEQVLVHCVGGCGRTGMFVACLMVRAGLEAKEAILTFRRSRRCGPETLEQLAYVIRFAQKRKALGAHPTVQLPHRLRVRFSLASSGERTLVAKGGLSSIFAGRLQLPEGGTRRVALKVLRSPLDDEGAHSVDKCILALQQAGVRLPRMAMHKLGDGTWVQVSPLFGSICRGSKFHQPSLFYKLLDAKQKAFALDQLTRVANAGYSPSLDLFVMFTHRSKGIVPIDLDLIDEQPDILKVVRKLLTAIIQLGESATERDELLAVGRAVARPAVREAMDDLLGSEVAFKRCWQLE